MAARILGGFWLASVKVSRPITTMPTSTTWQEKERRKLGQLAKSAPRTMLWSSMIKLGLTRMPAPLSQAARRGKWPSRVRPFGRFARGHGDLAVAEQCLGSVERAQLSASYEKQADRSKAKHCLYPSGGKLGAPSLSQRRRRGRARPSRRRSRSAPKYSSVALQQRLRVTPVKAPAIRTYCGRFSGVWAAVNGMTLAARARALAWVKAATSAGKCRTARLRIKLCSNFAERITVQ
jgi:hypothetical protein